MTVLALMFVARYGPNLPIADDFDVVDVAAGGRLFTLEWLWSLHNEHRVLLPRLILLSLYRLSNIDFRVGMFSSVAALAALAAASIAIAARRPGGCRTYDVLFPLLLLNPSHATNVLWSWQIQFVLSTVIAGVVILLIVARAGWPSPSTAATVGVCLALLPLCGANGVARFLRWPAGCSLRRSPTGSRILRVRPRTALVVLIAAVPAVFLTIIYFRGYHLTGQHPAAPEFSAVFLTSLQFISLMLGTQARALWPASGVAALAVIASSIVILAHVSVKRRSPERACALGLLCAFGAFACLALTVGLGRAGAGEGSGFALRYVTLVTPIWIAVFFTWDIYTSAVVRRVALTCAVSAVLVLLWPSTRDAIEAGRNLAVRAGQFVADVREGASDYVLVKRHTGFLHPSQDLLAAKIAMLRKARIGVFSNIQTNPTFNEVEVPITPKNFRLLRWENGTAHVRGVDPYLHYVLPQVVAVAGIRIKYSHANKFGSPARFRAAWASVKGVEPTPSQYYSNWRFQPAAIRSRRSGSTRRSRSSGSCRIISAASSRSTGSRYYLAKLRHEQNSIDPNGRRLRCRSRVHRRLAGLSARLLREELDVLIDLVGLSESRRLPIRYLSHIEAIRVRMEHAGLSPRDLVAFIGDR